MYTDILSKIKMNKTVIYGVGNVAKLAIGYLKNTLENFDECIIGATVSSEQRIQYSYVDDIAIKPIDEYIKEYKNLFFLVAVSKRFYNEIKSELLNRGIANFTLFDSNLCINYWENELKKYSTKRYEVFKKNLNKNELRDDEYLIFLSKQFKNTVDFEINIADHCNLNCQSCNHFSPIANERFVNFDSLANDLQRVNEIYGKKIRHVMLLGGEPLLHPQINEVLKISRKFLPNARLSLTTNGILLPKMNEEFWQLMKELDISLDATIYPIKFPYDKWENKAKKYGVRTNFSHMSLGGRAEEIKTTYLMPIEDESTFNPYIMYAKCAHANTCVVLRNGRMYTCSFAANIHHYNAYFSKNIPADAEVSIDIYKNDREKIDDFLRWPNKMCSHCNINGYVYDIPWKVSRKKLEEWRGY